MSSVNPTDDRKAVTVPSVRARKGGDKLRMITAYDTPTARIADRAGADIILVGDSVGNVVLGFDDTLRVTMDAIVHHTAAVARAKTKALIVGDMPWMSYHVSEERTAANAGRIIREGGAGAVKLEGGRDRIDMVRAIVRAEIPVMGHLGLTPQSVHTMGGYRVQGKDLAAAQAMLDDAKALEKAGVFSIVLEGVPDVLAGMITEAVEVPTIGIGAGSLCDGQVLVFHDAVGFHGDPDRRDPKFVRRYADLDELAVAAVRQYFDDVQRGHFPGEAETYHMDEESARRLRGAGSEVVYLNPMNEDGTALGG